MRNLSQKFKGTLPQNSRKREDAHPDFAGKLVIWATTYSAAAWLSNTNKNDLYLSIRLTSDDASQSEKIKLALWRNHESSTAEDPLFKSIQEISGHEFALRAWISPDGDNYRLEIAIEPANAASEVSDAVQKTRERIAELLEQTALPTLSPAKESTISLPTGSQHGEPDDIPF